MSIDALSELIGKPEFRHVLLNHLPVTGTAVATLVLVCGVAMRRRAVILLGIALVGVFAASAYPVVHYGQLAYDRVYSMLYYEGQGWLTHHKRIAERWQYLYYATAGVCLVGFVLGCRRRWTLWIAAPLVLVMGIGCVLAGAWISDLGGKARHPEFRIAPAPPPPTAPVE